MVLPLLVVLLLGLVSPVVLAQASIQPPAELIHPVVTRSTPIRRENVLYERETNAKRMAAGLPPLPPRSQRRQFSAADLEPRKVKSPEPSAIPTKKFKGYIQITNTKTGDFIGWVGSTPTLFGELGPVPDLSDALEVSAGGLKLGLNGPLEIKQTNGASPYGYIGGIVGFADTNNALKPGSFNYLYIGFVDETAPFATPAPGPNSFSDATGIPEDSESAIWIIETETGQLTAEWINPDGSIASKSNIVYYPPDDVLLIVGGNNAFDNAFGPAVPVTLELIPA